MRKYNMQKRNTTRLQKPIINEHHKENALDVALHKRIGEIVGPKLVTEKRIIDHKGWKTEAKQII